MNVPGNLNAILSHKGSTVWSISPDATVYQAILLMAEHNVGALIILQEGKVKGIISERDYTRKGILKKKLSQETQVKEIMTDNVVTARSDQSVEDCLRVMTDKHIRHLPVLEKGKLIGLVSIGDLVKWVISAQSAAINQLESYITGDYSG